MIKSVFWLSFMASTSLIALYVVASSFRAENDALRIAVGLFFGLHPLGAIWMLDNVMRSPRREWKYVLMSLVPYSFVWYYFAHYREGRMGRG